MCFTSESRREAIQGIDTAIAKSCAIFALPWHRSGLKNWKVPSAVAREHKSAERIYRFKQRSAWRCRTGSAMACRGKEFADRSRGHDRANARRFECDLASRKHLPDFYLVERPLAPAADK
jgi:hypothetical protein